MSDPQTGQKSRSAERRTRQRAANRGLILDAARKVAARGDSELSLRAVALEAGYAPASIYEYFRNRSEMMLALAADDLSQLARTLREQMAQPQGMGRAPDGRLASAAHLALDYMAQSSGFSAAAAIIEDKTLSPESERLYNGKLIGLLTTLAEVTGRAPLRSRDDQLDVMLAAASIAGIAILARAGRLKALGYDEAELLRRLDRRFAERPTSP